MRVDVGPDGGDGTHRQAIRSAGKSPPDRYRHYELSWDGLVLGMTTAVIDQKKQEITDLPAIWR